MQSQDIHLNGLVFKTLRCHQLLTTVFSLSSCCSFTALTNCLLWFAFPLKFCQLFISRRFPLPLFLQIIHFFKECCHGLSFLFYCFSETQFTIFVMVLLQYFSGHIPYQHFHTTTIISILSLPLKNDWPEFHLSCIEVESLPSSLSVVRPFLIRQM